MNQPEPDAGAGRSSRTPARPRSVVQIGQILHWANPAAVDFGRRMTELLTGQAVPADLMAASKSVKADVGVWAKFWQEHVVGRIGPDSYDSFRVACLEAVGRKRKSRGINLAKVAYKVIVPGELRAFVAGSKGA